jgi:putative heme-binding domain-containing protein
VDPNREVAAQYLQYTVQTKDHEILAGVVTEDTAAGMTIKMAGGSAHTVERSRILSASSTGQSLMPEGLEAGMTVGDMADLLTFIETLR